MLTKLFFPGVAGVRVERVWREVTLSLGDAAGSGTTVQASRRDGHGVASVSSTVRAVVSKAISRVNKAPNVGYCRSFILLQKPSFFRIRRL